MKVVLSGNQAKLYVNGVYRHQYSYSAAFSGGKVGFRTSKGQAHFDNLLFTNSQTERSLYALGNQTIATRVSGDPVSTNNGLFYIFSDHLGSTSVLATSTGNQVPGSRATYYPFGSPRTAPTQTITDRNFTGQKENLELGLIYFNARYYLPNLARFLTPDTLVPDGTNPQAYNRYSYVLNNPLRFTDPSGHCGADGSQYPDEDQAYIVQLTKQCWTLKSFLESYYGVLIHGKWTYRELASVSLGLLDMASGMGLEYLRDFIQGTNILRERGVWKGDGKNIATTDVYGKNVTFYDIAFASKDLARWATIHEFGHVFNQKNMIEPTGSIELIDNAILVADWVVNTLTDHPHERYDRAREGFGGKEASAYGEGNPYEGFAESWAAYFFQGSWDVMGAGIYDVKPRTSPSATRLDFIQEEIHAYQLSVDQIIHFQFYPYMR